ncbi:MAG: ribosome assembly RNA-binding protein YhbY [Myxococcales bacterium]|jgi:RNA-binding protein|nr:ribosome assembly RNA-binding protein YhbY [Myxococcales bacterium]
MALSGKARRFLRGLGHHLDPVLQVGKDGLTEAFIAAVEQALLDHELIKLKIGENAPMERRELADAVAQTTRAELVQVLGRTSLLYRPNPDAPMIKLPDKESTAASPSANDVAKVAEPPKPNEPSSGNKHTPAFVPKSRMKRGPLPHRSSKLARR